MCGHISIYYKNKEADGVIIRQLTKKIIHRGPDDTGYFIKDNIAFGFNRLSIIDLEGGNQPFKKENKTIIFIKENLEVPSFSESLSSILLKKIADLEKNNINQRLQKSKKKIVKNKSLKKRKKRKSVFDKHKIKIFKNLENGLSKVKILENLKAIDANIEDKTIQSLIAFIKKSEKEKIVEEEEKLYKKNKETKKISDYSNRQTAKRDIYNQNWTILVIRGYKVG